MLLTGDESEKYLPRHRFDSRISTGCAEVNGVFHSETSAIPAVRLAAERPLLRSLPSLRPALVPIADSLHVSAAQSGWLIAGLYLTTAVA